jgi:hypothetical protein
MNSRRARRLSQILCSHFSSPSSVHLLVDVDSFVFVDSLVSSIRSCGFEVAFYQEPPEIYLSSPTQGAEAEARHEPSNQLERRIKIAKARNFLLRKALEATNYLGDEGLVVWMVRFFGGKNGSHCKQNIYPLT